MKLLVCIILSVCLSSSRASFHFDEGMVVEREYPAHNDELQHILPMSNYPETSGSPSQWRHTREPSPEPRWNRLPSSSPERGRDVRVPSPDRRRPIEQDGNYWGVDFAANYDFGTKIGLGTERTGSLAGRTTKRGRPRNPRPSGGF